MSLDDLKARNEARAHMMSFLKVYFICLGVIVLAWAYSCR